MLCHSEDLFFICAVPPEFIIRMEWKLLLKASMKKLPKEFLGCGD